MLLSRQRSKHTCLTRLSRLLLWAFVAPHLAASAQARPASSAAHRAAPQFSAFDLTHHRISLASYRGKVVLLNFWATWCAPCLVELPAFAEWQKQFGSPRFQVIAVSMDDDRTEALATAQKLKLSFPVIMGDEHLGAAYGGVLGLPVTFLIDAHGTIQTRYDGAADLPRTKRDIERLLSRR